MINAVSEFSQIIQNNKSGKTQGIYSVCSAHEGIIRAAMRQAMEDQSILLVESTSNQVDQFGGYTGMQPADFIAYVYSIAASMDFPKNRILLGGDHLGPNAWQNEPAETAMEKAHELIRQYVIAGYRKIHLDCSMFLADDDGDRHKPQDNYIVAARAAALCRTAEETYSGLQEGTSKPVYIIGTEVPIPGGATEHEEGLNVTPATDARETVKITKDAFLKINLHDAWNRVCALVVQPGVEFGDDQVFDYDPEKAENLTHALDDDPRMVFEAHSTDYQTVESLTSLVNGHFCIQKVGPQLTFAWREALFALSDIENATLPADKVSNLKTVLEEVMLSNPQYWKKYYSGTALEQGLKRKYSYSDRSRYYWPNKRLHKAVQTLFHNLNDTSPSPTLFSQYLPAEYQAWRSGKIDLKPEMVAEYHVQLVLQTYSQACQMGTR